jgi:hypothetical protein
LEKRLFSMAVDDVGVGVNAWHGLIVPRSVGSAAKSDAQAKKNGRDQIAVREK